MINLSNISGVEKVLIDNDILESVWHLCALDDPEIYRCTCSLLGNLMNEGDPVRAHILSNRQLISHLILHQVEIGSP